MLEASCWCEHCTGRRTGKVHLDAIARRGARHAVRAQGNEGGSEIHDFFEARKAPGRQGGGVSGSGTGKTMRGGPGEGMRGATRVFESEMAKAAAFVSKISKDALVSGHKCTVGSLPLGWACLNAGAYLAMSKGRPVKRVPETCHRWPLHSLQTWRKAPDVEALRLLFSEDDTKLVARITPCCLEFSLRQVALGRDSLR